jgi:hypothetical protein
MRGVPNDSTASNIRQHLIRLLCSAKGRITNPSLIELTTFKLNLSMKFARDITYLLAFVHKEKWSGLLIKEAQKFLGPRSRRILCRGF